MGRRLGWCWVGVALAVTAGPVSGQEAVPPAPGREAVAEALEGMVRRELHDHAIPAGSVALVEGGRVTWARGFGLARPADGTPATAATVYRVGSVSKLFTDLAVMRLVEADKLDLDVPVTTYLPDFTPKNPFGTAITLRHLMTHRAGLVRETPVGSYFDETGPGLAESVRSLNTTTLVHEPGTKTKYSNAGIAVVGRAVEAVTGEPFEAAARRLVIDAFGLDSTGFTADPSRAKDRAAGLMWTYDGRTFPAPAFPLGTAPAGNLESSVLDLGKFVGSLLTGGAPVVTKFSLEQMWTPQGEDATRPRRFGLGFAISDLDGHRRVGHAGAVYGFAAELALLPDDRVGVAVVLSKDGANAVATRIGDAALRLLLAAKAGKPLPRWTPTQPVPRELARRVAGKYGAGDAAVELTDRDGRLYLTRGRGGFRVELKSRGGALEADDALAVGTTVTPGDGRVTLDGRTLERADDPMPPAPPDRFAGLIGEYGWDHNTLYVLERGGKLWVLIEWFFYDPLEEAGPDTFKFPDRGLYAGETLKFTRDATGRAVKADLEGVAFPRRKIDGDDGSTFRITPVRPVADLRREALAAEPPPGLGGSRKPDLVDLTKVIPGLKLDVRYASTNNFLSTPFYTEPRAFFQRPAAEALAKAHAALGASGYGLLIHDAYRPWHVTKMFWEATPPSGKGFVADPSKGSKHNRGCAVDLTLYELATGKPVEMVGGYDEFSTRSSPDYPGGTARQRWHRELLRRAMEAQGFTVNEVEWWHFDYEDWPEYPVLNRTFEQVEAR